MRILRREELQSLTDGVANSLDGSGGGFSDKVLEFGEDLLDGIHARLAFVAAELSMIRLGRVLIKAMPASEGQAEMF